MSKKSNPVLGISVEADTIELSSDESTSVLEVRVLDGGGGGGILGFDTDTLVILDTLVLSTEKSFPPFESSDSLPKTFFDCSALIIVSEMTRAEGFSTLH